MTPGTTPFAGTTASARTRFVRDVASRTPLPPHLTAEAAAVAVMCTVTERLTSGGAHALIQALPDAVRPLFERCVAHRAAAASSVDRSELLERTAEHLGVTPARAEIVCRAVLSAVREQLPRDVAAHVAAQLPKEIKALWYSEPPPVDAPIVSATEPESLRERVLQAIERVGDLPPGVDGAGAFMAVMCIFSQRLSGGEARHVLMALPGTLRPLLTTCTIHRDEAALAFDRDELLARVAEHLGVSTSAAESTTRAVFGAVKGCLPTKDIEDAAGQLPPDLRSLWLGA